MVYKCRNKLQFVPRNYVHSGCIVKYFTLDGCTCSMLFKNMWAPGFVVWSLTRLGQYWKFQFRFNFSFTLTLFAFQTPKCLGVSIEIPRRDIHVQKILVYSFYLVLLTPIHQGYYQGPSSVNISVNKSWSTLPLSLVCKFVSPLFIAVFFFFYY